MKSVPRIEILGNLKEEPFLTFIVGVHGDEKAPVKAINILRNRIKNIPLKKNIKVIYANTEALRKNIRFVDEDLNNSFLERGNGTYEEELAKFLKKELRKTEYNFDFHTTNFDIKGSYGVIAVYNNTIKEILSCIGMKNNIFVNKECLIKYCPNGIGFEIGYDKDKHTVGNTLKIMERILEHFEIIPKKEKILKIEPNIFLIYKLIKKSEFSSIEKNVVDFKRVNKGDLIGTKKNGEKYFAEEIFYPIRVNDEIFIRMSKKICFEE